MSTIDALRRLSAIEDIKILKARYFTTMDAKDWDGYAAVFAEDAVMDMTDEVRHHGGEPAASDSTIHVGREAICAYVRGTIDAARTVHQGHMPIIEVTDLDRAVGTWQLADWVDFGDRQLHGWGHYHEEYRRVDGSWLISRLALTRLRTEWSDSRDR